MNEGRIVALDDGTEVSFVLDRPASARWLYVFVQGTRDRLADLDLMSGVWNGLGARASTHIVDGGDHSFEVLKRSGRDREEVLDEIAGAVAGWLAQTLSA